MKFSQLQEINFVPMWMSMNGNATVWLEELSNPDICFVSDILVVMDPIEMVSLQIQAQQKLLWGTILKDVRF